MYRDGCQQESLGSEAREITMRQEKTFLEASPEPAVREDAFMRSGYRAVRQMVSDPLRSFLYEYALKSAREGRLKPGDAGVPGTPCCYGDALMESLLDMLLPQIESETGLKLYPTYSYLRVYKPGDVLKRHQDRPSCEVSVTLCLGYAAEKPWPIWIERDDRAQSIELEAGDGMLYKGIEVPHWREAFRGEHAAQVFLHYVDRNGPHTEWKYDKRGSLAGSPMVRSMLEQFIQR